VQFQSSNAAAFPGAGSGFVASVAALPPRASDSVLAAIFQ
jgi:hypothetical protein